MLKLILTQQAEEEYFSLIRDGQIKVVEKINALLDNTLETPYTGLGSPEPLRTRLSGKRSRRITQKGRLVYEVVEDKLIVHQCRGHYSDK